MAEEVEKLKKEVEELKRLVQTMAEKRQLELIEQELRDLENDGSKNYGERVRHIESEIKRLNEEVRRGSKLFEMVAEIRSDLKDIERRVAKLESAIYGDSGEGGLIYKMARLESKIDDVAKKSLLSITLTAGTFLTIIITLIHYLAH